jgi:mRNA-degrading endonuclease RelE of RelBE toxin-antitoxin system
MMRVVMAAQAQADFAALPLVIQARVAAIVERLANWPDVAGAKPLRKALKGHYRIRTGDWRVLFQVKADVIVVRIAHRSTVYED